MGSYRPRSFLVLLLRKRVFNVAVAFVGAVGVASYVQAVLLERWYATCRWSQVIWSDFTTQMIVSGLIVRVLQLRLIFSLP